MVKRNARNVVIVGRYLVLKFPRDWNIFRIFREFALTWKAFLNGVSPPAILLGLFLVRPTVELPLKTRNIDAKLGLVPYIERAIEALAKAGIEHRELRHPENHVGLWRGKIVFIDFDHGRLRRGSRDLNKFRAWVEGIKRSVV